MFYRENLNIKMMRENFVKERILQKIFIAMDKWQAGWLAEEGGTGQRWVSGSSSTTPFQSFILKEEEEEEGDL